MRPLQLPWDIPTKFYPKILGNLENVNITKEHFLSIYIFDSLYFGSSLLVSFLTKFTACNWKVINDYHLKSDDNEMIYYTEFSKSVLD